MSAMLPPVDTAMAPASPVTDARRDLLARATERAAETGGVVVCWARGRLGPGTAPSMQLDRARGWGAAWSIALRGEDRLSALRAALADLFGRVETIGEAGIAPRVFGGLAFAVGGAARAPWTGFGDGRFVLPRFLEIVGADGTAWTAAAADGTSTRATSGEPMQPAGSAGAVDLARSRSAFREAVSRIVAEIRRGEVDKVVLARMAEARLSGAADVAAIVARLSASFPDCTTFAFRAGDATFLGATPERLFEKRGRRVHTEALAGSIDAAAPEAAARLLASDKDRAEHAFVVDDIARRLRGTCDEIVVAPKPEIRVLPHVLHLRTPIEGRLRIGATAIDLLEALHPTPAVGGVPARAALDRIAALEPDPRGWYSGPIGWIDATGDAELWVALRSGVVCGDRAFLHAGGGIVEGSSPEAEWAETELKMRALASALEPSR